MRIKGDAISRTGTGFVCHASDVALSPGRWPKQLETVLFGKERQFTFLKEDWHGEDLVGVYYVSGGEKLLVIND